MRLGSSFATWTYHVTRGFEIFPVKERTCKSKDIQFRLQSGILEAFLEELRFCMAAQWTAALLPGRYAVM